MSTIRLQGVQIGPLIALILVLATFAMLNAPGGGRWQRSDARGIANRFSHSGALGLSLLAYGDKGLLGINKFTEHPSGEGPDKSSSPVGDGSFTVPFRQNNSRQYSGENSGSHLSTLGSVAGGKTGGDSSGSGDSGNGNPGGLAPVNLFTVPPLASTPDDLNGPPQTDVEGDESPANPFSPNGSDKFYPTSNTFTIYSLVPEPSSWRVTILGVLSLGAALRWRKSRQPDSLA
jgi:hypothetical protein